MTHETPVSSYKLDWTDLAFASKKPLNELHAIFIAAPREMSQARLKQLIKTYLPKGHILFGLAKESHVLGLENQPQFQMLTASDILSVIEKVNISDTTHKIYILDYFQRELPFMLEKLDVKKVLFINGSWYHAFHLRPEYYVLTKRKIEYEKVSPFTDELEAQHYARRFELEQSISATDPNRRYTELEMLGLANEAAKESFDFGGHQTGISLGRKTKTGYQLLTTTFNRVVPYQTYAMHHGASREQYFSPPNDLNHYDVNHAEVELLAQAARDHLDLDGTTLFINLLPCPTCARMFTSTPIAEFIYSEDHSAGYAIKMLEAAGKNVRRVVV